MNNSLSEDTFLKAQCVTVTLLLLLAYNGTENTHV